MKAWALALWIGCAAAQAPEPVAADLQEQVLRVPVTVKDLYGREETKPVVVTAFRPRGAGPFPLLILNHGRAPAERRAGQPRQRYEPQARYFVSKGFAVLVPTRIGYGETYGDFDPEQTGDCQQMRPQAAAKAASDQVLAVLEHAKTLPGIDASRWVVAGQSMGGFTSIAVTARHPPGLVAAINFAGGGGGNPDFRPGNPCSPQALAVLWKGMAADAKLPMLWLYWQNDRYWGPEIPQTWAQAWRDGGGQLEFQQLPPHGSDGHGGFTADMDAWVPIVEAWLAKAGFERSGLIPRPPASGFASLDETDKIPTTDTVRHGVLQRFLAAKKPRALALGARGAAGFASGDWALGRALGYCERTRGEPCKLYAVDDDVVWTP